ncbi:hypothetical protein ACFYXM_08170 [Streptomyces sp. NPDC002476]|uniref:hypothetical protein n=1 Tax=Streptomyces sp. NPDC002476 TaxID=3364648 RepID=UPI00369D6392
MSEIAATTVHEAYAFACMRCGCGWEQSYEIEHHVDGSGKPFIIYKADGERVPSPLSRPTCLNCGGHVVRIMRAGRVSTVQQLLHHSRPGQAEAEGPGGPEILVAPAGPIGAGGAIDVPTGEQHHWQLSNLLRPFHRK